MNAAVGVTLTYGNNRYSSQNMKGGASDFDDEEELIDDQENGLEVADENCVGSKYEQNFSQVGYEHGGLRSYA